MKTVLVNLPYARRVQRRWVGSYYAPNFLTPPLELMAVGTVIREWKGGEVHVLDAVAEGWYEPRLRAELQRLQPGLLVTMPGFNTFPRDMELFDRLKAALPGVRSACFGYLPTQFAREILERTQVDVVVRDEPEETFADVWDWAAGKGSLEQVAGVAFRAADGIRVNPARTRQKELDALPFPDHALVRLELYNESYLERPIGAMITERGCPYRCTYCVRTFGTKLVSRSAESILAEMQLLKERHGIRNIRFMDDTFTMNRARTMKLCQAIIDRGLDVAWTCLTRVDVVDEELLALMKRAGCRRMYVSIESGSQRVLDYYKKGLTVETVRRKVPVIQQSGIEASIFFMVGAPAETDEDVGMSIALAKELDLDYVIVTKLQYWPGTELFEREGGKVAFDPFTEGELLYEPEGYEKAVAWQRRFYREFYFRPRYFAKRLGTLLRSPRDTVVGFSKLAAWLVKPPTSEDFI